MDCLTYIAVNDMAHELCDISPCADCGKKVFCTENQCDDLSGHEFEQVDPKGRNIAPWVLTHCPNR